MARRVTERNGIEYVIADRRSSKRGGQRLLLMMMDSLSMSAISRVAPPGKVLGVPLFVWAHGECCIRPHPLATLKAAGQLDRVYLRLSHLALELRGLLDLKGVINER